MLYILILLGVVAGYQVAARFVKPGGIRKSGIVPIIGGMLGGAATYAIIVAAILPASSGPIVWADSVQHISNEDELNALLSETDDRVTLVDFYADWCPPCRRTAPALNALAESGAPMAVVDVDRSTELAEQFQIESLPTTLIFDGHNEVRRSVGGHSERELRQLLSPGAGS